MCISKIYSYHTEIFDNIYEKYKKYRKSNIKDMAKALNLDEEYIKNLIFWEFKIILPISKYRFINSYFILELI